MIGNTLKIMIEERKNNKTKYSYTSSVQIDDPNASYVMRWYQAIKSPSGEAQVIDGQNCYALPLIGRDGFNWKVSEKTAFILCPVVLNYSSQHRCFLLSTDSLKVINSCIDGIDNGVDGDINSGTDSDGDTDLDDTPRVNAYRKKKRVAARKLCIKKQNRAALIKEFVLKTAPTKNKKKLSSQVLRLTMWFMSRSCHCMVRTC